MLISCAVIAQLIFAFVFAYSKVQFSHGTAYEKTCFECFRLVVQFNLISMQFFGFKKERVL